MRLKLQFLVDPSCWCFKKSPRINDYDPVESSFLSPTVIETYHVGNHFILILKRSKRRIQHQWKLSKKGSLSCWKLVSITKCYAQTTNDSIVTDIVNNIAHILILEMQKTSLLIRILTHICMLLYMFTSLVILYKLHYEHD